MQWKYVCNTVIYKRHLTYMFVAFKLGCNSWIALPNLDLRSSSSNCWIHGLSVQKGHPRNSRAGPRKALLLILHSSSSDISVEQLQRQFELWCLQSTKTPRTKLCVKAFNGLFPKESFWPLYPIKNSKFLCCLL